METCKTDTESFERGYADALYDLGRALSPECTKLNKIVKDPEERKKLRNYLLDYRRAYIDKCYHRDEEMNKVV